VQASTTVGPCGHKGAVLLVRNGDVEQPHTHHRPVGADYGVLPRALLSFFPTLRREAITNLPQIYSGILGLGKAEGRGGEGRGGGVGMMQKRWPRGEGQNGGRERRELASGKAVDGLIPSKRQCTLPEINEIGTGEPPNGGPGYCCGQGKKNKPTLLDRNDCRN